MALVKWDIDSAHSSIDFTVRHMLVSKVRGRFTKWTGKLEIDEQNLSHSRVDVDIDASSVDTHEAQRDAHLRSNDFFGVDQHPRITFKSKRVEEKGSDRLLVTGDLTIRGTTKSVVLDVDGPTAPVKDPWGNQRSAVNATTKINRQDYGVKWNATMDNGGVVVGDDVAITIDAEMVQKK